MGCGKTTVAQLLAARLSCFYFDLDYTIESEEGRDIPEIFATEGEAGFRLLEFEYLQRILDDYRDFPTTMILSLGGGTVTAEPCAELIRNSCTCIYLRAGINELVHNLEITGTENRPLLSGDGPLREKVRKMMAGRSEIYEKAADITVDIDGLSPEEIADDIVRSYRNNL